MLSFKSNVRSSVHAVSSSARPLPQRRGKPTLPAREAWPASPLPLRSRVHLLHGLHRPGPARGRGTMPAARLTDAPTARSQLDFFVGTWAVRGLPEAAELTVGWQGKRMFVTHPTTPDGRQHRYADWFDDENPCYMRADMTPNRRPPFVSGGWQGNRWEWQRADCSERITYDRIDDDTLVVTEETRDTTGDDTGFACGMSAAKARYKLVRRYEATRCR